MLSIAVLLPLAVAILVPIIVKAREPAVYCVDHEEFFAPKVGSESLLSRMLLSQSWEVTHEDIISIMSSHPDVTEESMNFAKRVLSQSGIRSGSALPPNIVSLMSLLDGPMKSAPCSDEVSRDWQALVGYHGRCSYGNGIHSHSNIAGTAR